MVRNRAAEGSTLTNAAAPTTDDLEIRLEILKSFACIQDVVVVIRLFNAVLGPLVLLMNGHLHLAVVWGAGYAALVLSNAQRYKTLGAFAERVETDRRLVHWRELANGLMLAMLAVLSRPDTTWDIQVVVIGLLLSSLLLGTYVSCVLPELVVWGQLPICFGATFTLLMFRESSLLPATAILPILVTGGLYFPVLRAAKRLRDSIALKFEVLRARDEAERANQAKSNFIACMSHELRTPLNAILGFSEIIRHQALGPVGSPKYLEYAGDIHTSGKHLLNLINDILDLAKIESGKMELRLGQVNLGAVLDETLRVLAPKAAEKHLELVNALGAPVWSEADERAVKQVLINVLANALKYTPDGGSITINTYTDEHGNRVLTVSDTGPGMSAEFLTRVFRPFEQSDNMYDRDRGSTGLGLALVKGLMLAQGGSVALRSEAGVGTTVHLTFRGISEARAPRRASPVLLASANR